VTTATGLQDAIAELARFDDDPRPTLARVAG
jgi:hypothetical protein